MKRRLSISIDALNKSVDSFDDLADIETIFDAILESLVLAQLVHEDCFDLREGLEQLRDQGKIDNAAVEAAESLIELFDNTTYGEQSVEEDEELDNANVALKLLFKTMVIFVGDENSE